MIFIRSKIIIYTLIMLLCFFVNILKAEELPEMIKARYARAVERMKSGEAYATASKDKLSEAEIGDLFKKEISNGRIPLNIQDRELKQQIYTAQRELGEAIKEFDNIISSYPGYADVHIRLVEAYLAMGDEAKAMETYKKCLNLGFEGVTIPYDDLRSIFYEIAKADIGSGAEDSGKPVIDELMSLENLRLDSKYESLKKELDEAQSNGLENIIEQKRQEMIGIEIQRMIVNLELARFYIDTGRKEKAINELEYKKNEYDSKLGLFNKEDAKPLTDLYIQIDDNLVTMNSSLEFSEDQMLPKDINIILIPEGDSVDKSKFIKLSLIPGSESIRLLTYATNHGIITIPSGDYSVRILIPEIEIQNNYLPFRVELERDIYLVDLHIVEDPMITPSLKDKTKLWLEKSSDRQPVEIDFSQDVFSNATTMEIDSKYKTITSGLYKATLETKLNIKTSQQITIKIIAKEPPLELPKEIKIENEEAPAKVIVSPKETKSQVKIEPVKPTKQVKAKPKESSESSKTKTDDKDSKSLKTKIYEIFPGYSVAIFAVTAAVIIYLGIMNL
jgi:tetratricopeptide (TPR) repeat protein